MADRLTGRELLAIKARTGRAGRGLHQSLKQTEADRLALLREMIHLRAERDALKATVEQVRRLQELTIATSCRMHAIHQAEDTLRILDTPASAPESTEETDHG